jgi:hypothetical protein
VQSHCIKTVLLQIVLAVLLGSSTGCQKKDESPPPPKVAVAPTPPPEKAAVPGMLTAVQGEGSADCCEMVINSDLKGRMGRLIVQFPKQADAGQTRVDVFHPVEQKALKGGSSCCPGCTTWTSPRSGSCACRSNRATTPA